MGDRSFENPGILTLDFKGFDLNGPAVTSTALLKWRMRRAALRMGAGRDGVSAPRPG